MDFEPGLRTYLPSVESALDGYLPDEGESPKPLTDAMRYSVLGGGKRLRPALVLAACEACNGSSSDAMAAACAVEIVHCFSLIHDDLPCIDDDDVRRGRPTCHIVFGEAVALLAGDALFALAFELVAGSKAGAAGVIELSRGTGWAGVVGGETLDILNERAAPDPRLLAEIHRKKTGALFATAAVLGALCAGAPPAEVEALRRYGYALGQAFQIADDILDETSTQEAMGKPVGNDKDSLKMTYPRVFGLEKSRDLAEKAVEEAVGALGSLEGDTSFLKAAAQYALNRKV